MCQQQKKAARAHTRTKELANLGDIRGTHFFQARDQPALSLRGHKGAVTCLAFRDDVFGAADAADPFDGDEADGGADDRRATFFSGGDDCTLKHWDAASGSLSHRACFFSRFFFPREKTHGGGRLAFFSQVDRFFFFSLSLRNTPRPPPARARSRSPHRPSLFFSRPWTILFRRRVRRESLRARGGRTVRGLRLRRAATLGRRRPQRASARTAGVLNTYRDSGRRRAHAKEGGRIQSSTTQASSSFRPK